MKRQMCLLFAIAVAVSGIAIAQPPAGGRGPGGPGVRGPGAGGPGPRGQGPEAGRHRGPSLGILMHKFDEIDANSDGQLSRDELRVAINNERGEVKRRPGGPPPRPGQVLPAFVAESLNMTPQQQEQLAALHADVDKRLAEILTDQQQQQLEDHHRRRPRGDGEKPREGGRRDRGNDRPPSP